MTTKTQQAKIVTPRDLPTLRYPLPESWINAIGILKGKGIHPLRYQRQIRKGWARHLKKLSSW